MSTTNVKNRRRLQLRAAGDRIAGFFRTVIRFRYLIALGLFIVLVLAQVNGSSIGIWNRLFHTDSTIVAGTARPIRSDEWRVQTPYFLSQQFDEYSVDNPNISTSGQNMIVSYGAPVWDISTLAKPLNWGFLLFGPSYGLAWYWNMKLLLLILLSFELCMIITKRNTLVSAMGAIWIAFSPAVQWWFMQHVCDILFYMEAVVVTFYYFLHYHERFWTKTGFALLFGLSCVGYALTVYPGIQIPLAYLGALLMVLILLDFRKQIRFNRVDGMIAAGTFALIVLMFVHIYLISKGAISATLSTSYPGKRVSSGGGGLPFTFYSFLTNPFLPYKDVTPGLLNDCEISGFFNFLPAVLLVLPLMIRKRAKDLKYGISLAVFSLLCVGYLYIKIPVFLAKITLLSYVTTRIQIAYGISAVLLSIWALSEISRQQYAGRVYSSLAAGAITFSYLLSILYTPLKHYVRLRYYLVVLLVLLLLNYLLLRGFKRSFAAVMTVLALSSGATVNPVTIGLSNFYNTDLSRGIQTVRAKDPNACWISLASDVYGGYLYANGAKDLDGTNYYPDLAKWKILDPAGKYYTTYNRYAHIEFALTNGDTSVQVNKSHSIASPPDIVVMNLGVNELRKLNVSYVLTTNRKVEQFDTPQIRFTSVTSKPLNGLFIYHVQYHS